MAKRTRGTRAAPHRPGQRIANNRPTTAPRSSVPAGASGVATSTDPSGELVIEQALAAEAVSGAPAASITGPDIRRSTPGRVKVKPNSLLAARAETEYIYVGQDLRKIAVVAAALFAVLILLWVLLVIVGVFGIY